MNPKTTIGLLVTLVVALAGLWWAQSSSQKGENPVAVGPKPLFDPPLGEMAEFEWVQAGSPPLKFTMQKDTAASGSVAGEKWRLVAPAVGPAEHYVVNNDVTKIKDLKYAKAYSKNDADRPTDEMAGLKDPQRRAKLTDKNGKSVVVRIGARQTLSTKTYVQKEGDDAIYLVDADLNSDLKKGLSDYRGKRVVEFNATDAVRLEAMGENQYVFAGSGGKWTMDSPMKARADKNAVANVVRSLSSLYADKFVDDEPKSLRPFGLDRPRLELTVTTETKTPKPAPAPPASAPAEPEFDITKSQYKIAFGGVAEDKVFAKLLEPAASAVFQIPESTFKQLAVKLDDLRDKQIVDVEPAKAQRIVVTSGDDSVELTKKDGQWKITAGLGAGETSPAEFAAGEDRYKVLEDLKDTGFEASQWPNQGFAKPRSVIEVTLEGQMEPARITVGNVTASKTGAYVRNDREGFIAVVKAESVNPLIAKPIEFLGRDLLHANRESISKIELGFPKYTVAVVKDAGTWKFASPVQGTAETTAVTNLLNDLSQLRGRRVVGRVKDAATFSLESPTVKVTVSVDNPPKPRPKPQPTTTSAPTGPPEMEMEPQPPSIYAVSLTRIGERAYAMASGGSVICEIDAKVVDDALAELLGTQVATVEASQARRLAFSGAEKFAFEKLGDAWKLVGEASFAVDPTKVTELFTTINGLHAKEYAIYANAKLANYGLESPRITITAETTSGSPVALSISAQGPEKGGRYARLASQSDRVFVLKQEDVDKLSKRVQDFEKSG